MKKVLIIREGSLGDLILTFPVFYNLKKNKYYVFVGSKGIYRNFVERYGFVDKFIPLDSYEYLFFFEKNNNKLEEFLKNFEIVLAYTDENEIIGENLKRNFKGKIIFHPVKKEKLNVHITDHLLEPLKKIFNKNLDLFVNLDLKRKNEFFVIHPGSGSKCKNWGKENFLKLCEILKNVKLILGPAEEDEIEFWKANFKGEIFFNIDLGDIVKIAEKTIAYIGNDSGITHLFSITGVMTIAIFGPTSPYIWGPRGKNVKIVYKKIECSPCQYEKMKNCKEKKCLKEIKPENIFSLLSDHGSGSGND